MHSNPRPVPVPRALLLTPVALAAVLMCQPALSATRTWTGGAGGSNSFWDLVANWNTGLPVAGDIAAMGAFDTTIRNGTWALQSMSGTGTLTVTGGALSVNAASSMGSLLMSGGSVGGSGTLTLGSFTWNGGDLGNASSLGGVINVNGAATLNATQHVVNYGQTLNLKGNSTWGPSGRLYLYAAGSGYGQSTVNLSAGKTLLLQGADSSAYYQIDGGGTFNNAGTVTKTGANLLYIDAAFNNTGTLNVNGGEVHFRNTRTLGGTVNTVGGSTVHFLGVTTFDPAGNISGDGNLVFGGSSNLLGSGTRTFGGAGTKTITGGSLGGAGTMVFNNLVWQAGSMGVSTDPGGVTTVNGSATLGSGTKYVNYGRTLNLNGDTTWDTNGVLYIYGAGTGYGESVVNLAAGKTMSMAENASSYDQFAGTGTFNNAGTITKSGTGIFYVDSNFNNTGVLNINAGEAQFRNTKTLGGAINVAADATLRFNGSTTFASSLALAGDGDLVFDGSYNILTSGSKKFTVGTGTNWLTGGVLGGGGTMTFKNLTWIGGSMGYSASVGGATTVTGTTLLNPGYHYLNYGRTLNLSTTIVDAGGALYMYAAGSGYGDSVVNLKAGKTLNFAGNAWSTEYIAGAGIFNNAGTVTKSGSGVLNIQSVFNNGGTVNANAGEVQFSGTRTLGGTVNVASRATLHLNGTTTLDPTLVLAGAGKVWLDGSSVLQTSGTRTFGGGGKKTVSTSVLGGAATMVFDNLTWMGGTMGYSGSVGGVTTVTGATTLSSATHYLNYGRTLNLNGDTVWDANGGLYIYGAGTGYGESVANLASGKSMTLAGNASSYDQIYGPGTFNNAGTITKSGSGIFYIDSKFNNSGTLSGNKGTTLIRGALNNTGTLFANGGRVEVTTTTGLAQWDVSTQTLNAGTYRVTGTQPIALNLGYEPSTSIPALIKVNKANVYLKNAGAAIVTTTPDPDVNALTTLATNSGTLSLTSGAQLATTVALKNNLTGQLVVGSGSTLTVGGSGLRQSNTAATFLGGTMALKAFAFDAGTLSAGNAAGTVGNGVLSIIGGGTGLTFGALAQLNQDVTTSGWDTLAVQNGNAILVGTLSANFGAGADVGTYRFLTTDTGSVLGTFNSVVSNLDPGDFAVSAIYGAKFVDLKVTAISSLTSRDSLPVAVVPEPSTYAMLLAGLGVLGWQLRRRNAAA